MSHPCAIRICNIFVCGVFLCTLALASDQKSPTKLSDLPPEAQQEVSAALARALPGGVQHSTLTASDGKNRYGFGVSVAIDGNTVVVGSSYYEAAYVFVKPESGWSNMTQTAELTPSDAQDAECFGCSVAVSGNTVVVGAGDGTVNGNQGQGAAYVFVKPTSGWADMTETAKLTASDGISYAFFGSATGISGNTIVIGATFSSGDNPAPGTAYVFVKPIGGWTDMTQTAELTPSDSTDYDSFGISASISGGTVVIGASQDACGSCNPGPGEAYVFVEPSNGWVDMTETAKLTASDGEAFDGFGTSVSMSGAAVVVGAPNHASNGAVYVFVKPSGGWINMTQTAELVDGSSGGHFGNSVSISGDLIVAGNMWAHALTGRAFAFLKPSDGWRNTSKSNLALEIPFTYGYDMFGSGVATIGSTAVVGAYYAPTTLPCHNGGQVCTAGPGQAFVFTKK